MERECKNLNKTWPDLKQLALSTVRWRVGVVDVLRPGRDQGNYEEEEETGLQQLCVSLKRKYKGSY